MAKNAAYPRSSKPAKPTTTDRPTASTTSSSELAAAETRYQPAIWSSQGKTNPRPSKPAMSQRTPRGARGAKATPGGGATSSLDVIWLLPSSPPGRNASSRINNASTSSGVQAASSRKSLNDEKTPISTPPASAPLMLPTPPSTAAVIADRPLRRPNWVFAAPKYAVKIAAPKP